MAMTTKYVERPGGTEAVQETPPRPAIREHYIHIDDGRFDPYGDYYSEANETREIIYQIVRNKPEHLLLYAHGGLNSVESSAARVGKWQPVFKENGIRDIHFLWETGLYEEIGDLLRSKLGFTERRAAGINDWWDRMFERSTQSVGSALWKEMRSGAESAFLPSYAGDQCIAWLVEALKELPEGTRPKLHLVGHSAGSIWLGHLLRQWQHYRGFPINNLVLFAPACTHEFFVSHIKPAISNAVVKELHHFLLDDETELGDNVSQIYRKSLLYLVSRSYQQKDRVVPLLGMAKHLADLPIGDVKDCIKTYIIAERPDATASTTHGGLDNDEATMNSLLKLVLGREPARPFRLDDLQGY